MTTQTHTIPPQSGRGFHLKAGETIKIIDPEGQQVSDMWAIVPDDPIDWLSVSQTRDINERLFPVVGESFFSVRGQKILTLVEDQSPGPHDMLFPACNRALYEREGLHDHPNCHDNFMSVLDSEGIEIPSVPDPVNFFQNSTPQPDGRLEVLASRNPPGGYVVLRAETDLLIVLTACSVDFHPTNGSQCTAIEVQLL